MSNYDRVYEAARILELPETATIKEIRAAYHRLMKKWHPDTCADDPEQCEKRTREIAAAYKCLLDYCTNYRFSFKKEDLKRSAPPESGDLETFWYEHFGKDPMWSNGG